MFYVSSREVKISVLMLVVGLLLGSTKGDDIIELIQGVQKTDVEVQNNEELAQSFNHKIRNIITPTTPEHLKGVNLETRMNILSDGYHFHFYVDDEKVAVLNFNEDKEFIDGGWLTE
jgi:hypothetical protein